MNVVPIVVNDRRRGRPFALTASIFASTLSWIWGVNVSACLGQIVPDSSLPINSRAVDAGGEISIEDGTRINNLLFHSFSEFSVPVETVARFNNAPDVATIFSRVTGSDVSRIDGILAANGSANLFFLNPNGIVFGENARLDIGGSFVASTAESVRFANGTSFSTVEPEAPLLTVNVPVGLQFGESPGDIVNRSTVSAPVPGLPDSFPNASGLTVLPGRILALIGGDLRLESGSLTAFQGEVNLTSVEGANRVGVVPTATGIVLDSSGVEDFGSIDLSGTASIDTSGLGGGAIRLRGGDIAIRDNSRVVAATLGDIDGRAISIEGDRITVRDGVLLSTSTFGNGRGGDLELRALDRIDLIGTAFETLQLIQVQAVLGTLDLASVEGVTIVGTNAAGNAGNITLETSELTMQNGAVLATTTGSSGNGGDIALNVSESVDIDGALIVTGSLQGTTGNSGSIILNTQRLLINRSGGLNTFTFGAGSGGNLQVNASESVELLDSVFNAVQPTGLFANSIFGSGRGGNIDVRTQRMVMQGGAQAGNQSGALLGTGLVSLGGPGGNVNIEATASIDVIGISPDGRFGSGPGTTTFTPSPAGNVTISTRRLSVTEGGSIEATALDRGRGGSITVTATERLELSGTGIANRQGTPVEFPSSLGASSGREDFPNLTASGAAGDLRVNAGTAIVRDGARISVNSFGSGDAGILDINAEVLRLNEGGSLDARTVSGAGGNINLQAPQLQLEDGSTISTDAGNTDGGNISIESETLVALDNSDITANARQGRGGRVTIAAQGIFGTAFRNAQTPESDITATSELGPAFSGIVELKTPDVNTDAALVELAAEPIDPNQQIARGCAASQGNTFVVTGRGGVPENPTENLRSTTSWGDLRDWRSLTAEPLSRLLPQNTDFVKINPSESVESRSLSEATGWVHLEGDTVELVASPERSPAAVNGFDRSDCPPRGR
ncbi:filamentous hemagglutinin N-terminal domain-containing protein [Baaleninema sp.]|uniref:two-partner secretion domain-containing protein n=1 Tax=Baaleninema sp. TaxID=3101197 RepID=UPI003D0646B2